MNYTAKYLDSGFYTMSNKAAGALCTVLGQKLPKWGREKFVMLEANGHKLNAWLKRSDVRSRGIGRGWVWSIYAIRPDGGGSPVTLGREFVFQPIASTVTPVTAEVSK